MPLRSRHASTSRRTTDGAVVLLSLILSLTAAQELPNPLYQTDQFNTSTVFRQNLCVRANQVMFDLAYESNKKFSLENALDGMEIRTIHAISQYFELNPETGGIDEDYPGLTAVIMDELADRAGFTWRNSYAVTKEPIEGKTWTQLLEWTTDFYDISVDWWAHSTARMSLGVSFPEGWYDASIIMVGRKHVAAPGFNMWSFAAPFDAHVWIMIVLTLLSSGLVYYWMERLDKKSDLRHLQNDPAQNIFLSALAFTTHFEFRPQTNPARIFTLSLAFWSMLASAAYTANLASFLVVRNTPTIQFDKVEDVVRAGSTICVLATTQADEALQKEYPNAKVRRLPAEDEVFVGVMNGDCAVAVTTVSSWEFWKGDQDVNGDCELEWVGRTFRFIPAGFATISDSGTRCTSLIREVIHIHFLRMKEEGFIEDAWNKHLLRTASINCSEKEERGQEDTAQLTLKNMGGIFVLHFGLTLIAVAYAFGYKFFGFMAKRDMRLAQEKHDKKVAKLKDTRNIMQQHLKKHSGSRRLTQGIDMSLEADEGLKQFRFSRRKPASTINPTIRDSNTRVDFSDLGELSMSDSEDDAVIMFDTSRQPEAPLSSIPGEPMETMKGDIDLIKSQMAEMATLLKKLSDDKDDATTRTGRMETSPGKIATARAQELDYDG